MLVLNSQYIASGKQRARSASGCSCKSGHVALCLAAILTDSTVIHADRHTVASCIALKVTVDHCEAHLFISMQVPFTVSQMRKFADKLRNFSMTPSPDSQQTSGGPRRRHSILGASATHTPAVQSSHAGHAPTPGSVTSAIAPQRLLSQFGGSPQIADTSKQDAAAHKQSNQAAVTG